MSDEARPTGRRGSIWVVGWGEVAGVMGDDILRFEPRRGRPPEEDPDDFVLCARCGQSILATATRCPECGVHFQGEAQDFFHPLERTRGGRAGWLWVVLVVVLCAVLLGALVPR